MKKNKTAERRHFEFFSYDVAFRLLKYNGVTQRPPLDIATVLRMTSTGRVYTVPIISGDSRRKGFPQFVYMDLRCSIAMHGHAY